MKVTQIVLELLTVCNFRCRYCRDSSGAKKMIPFDLVQKMIVEFQALGIQKVQLDGGEPFLYQHIQELVAFIADRGLEGGIYTNAALVNDDLASFLSHYSSFKLAITLHLLNPQEDIDATFRGIDALRRVGIRPQLITVMSSPSLTLLPEVLRRIEDDGHTLVLNPLVPSGRAFDNFVLPLTPLERQQLAQIVAEERTGRRHTEIIDNASVDENALQVEKVQMNDNDEFALHINTDGEVLPFFSADNSTAIGRMSDLPHLRRTLQDPKTHEYLRKCQIAMRRRIHGRDEARSRRIVAMDVASVS